MIKNQKWFWLITILLLIYNCKAKEEINKNDAIPVTTGRVETKDLVYTLHQVGSLLAKNSVLIRSEAEGRVTGIFFEEGDEVKEGQLLIKLDDTKIKTMISQLQARIRQLEVQLANTQRTLERKEPLVKEDLVSKQEFDDLQSKIEIEKATFKEIKSQLAYYQELSSDTEIRAPFSGTTSERKVSVGDFLRVGDPVVQLVQLKPLEISFRIDERYKTKLYLQQPITLTVAAYPGKNFTGEVYFISPDIDLSTRTFLVKGRVENEQRLLNPGMFAEVTLVTEIHKNALVVPWESIIQLENETYLYVIKGEIAKKVPVQLGLVTKEEAEVLGSQLNPGQLVAKEGKYSLADGKRVKIVGEL
ncbi:MAG: efflux RND transporter periplasmic adaptor subunit [Desulfobacterota bacterium]|nr:efflux RND transporter periplasmic adaptor subunit [Thermodesulfobacteriota bacterium]